MSHKKQAKDAPIKPPITTNKLDKFLIFIDTNILLDFYRVRGRESGLSILKHIDDNLNRFITTSQVEMEFKKNRQHVILDSHKTFKLPGFEGLQLPAFISESKASKALARNQKELKSYAATLQTRMTRTLHKPRTHDPVFKTADRLFHEESDHNLTSKSKVRRTIQRRARERFCLGYPPRKSDDTSIGDAINWEWIVHCAAESGCHVVIVTRDSDYGVQFDKQSILNDWLATEFRTRISKKRKLLLTDRLSTALKLASIPVTAKEIAAEKALISARRPMATSADKMMEALRRSLDRVHSEEDWYDPSEPDPDDVQEPDNEQYEAYDDEPDNDEQYEAYHDQQHDVYYDDPRADGPDDGPPDDGPQD